MNIYKILSFIFLGCSTLCIFFEVVKPNVGFIPMAILSAVFALYYLLLCFLPEKPDKNKNENDEV